MDNRYHYLVRFGQGWGECQRNGCRGRIRPVYNTWMNYIECNTCEYWASMWGYNGQKFRYNGEYKKRCLQMASDTSHTEFDQKMPASELIIAEVEKMWVGTIISAIIPGFALKRIITDDWREFVHWVVGMCYQYDLKTIELVISMEREVSKTISVEDLHDRGPVFNEALGRLRLVRETWLRRISS